LRELRLASFSEYYEHVVADSSGESLAGLIDALSTNHTSFLREASHFHFLRQALLPRLRTRPAIHICSAPCSSGEEPYSIAITLLEELEIGRASCRDRGGEGGEAGAGESTLMSAMA